MKIKLVDQIRVNASLGECILWDSVTQDLWWTDIESKILYCRNFTGGKLKSFTMPERLCAFAFVQNKDFLLCAFETGFAIFSPKTKKTQWLKKVRKKDCGIRLNDGRVDPLGRFWVGEMVEKPNPVDPIPARLFCLEFDGTISVHDSGMGISNGLSWTVCGRNMFFADSEKNEIYIYDKNHETSFYQNKRLFAKTPSGIHPDGSCIDEEGFLWNAQWGSGKVIRYTRDGDVDFVLSIPCLQPTCVTFGGENLNYLIVSSANLEQTKSGRDDGDVFIYETPYTGVLENRFFSG